MNCLHNLTVILLFFMHLISALFPVPASCSNYEEFEEKSENLFSGFSQYPDTESGEKP